MLRLGVILPHTKIYGGVKRYFEIGNLCCEMGHHFTIFTADGSFSNWFPLKCEIKKHSDIEGIQLDAIFFSHSVKKIFCL